MDDTTVRVFVLEQVSRDLLLRSVATYLLFYHRVMCGHALLATGNGLEVADMRRRREQDWFGIHVPTSGPVNLSFKSYPPSSEDSISLTQEVGAVFLPVQLLLPRACH